MPALSRTGIVLIDPYNDFLHSDGKLTSALKDLDEKNTISHLKEVVENARLHSVPIYYGFHQQWTPDHYNGWKYMTPNHVFQQEVRLFEEGSFGS
jgi:Amidases related to nicotinamidase